MDIDYNTHALIRFHIIDTLMNEKESPSSILHKTIDYRLFSKNVDLEYLTSYIYYHFSKEWDKKTTSWINSSSIPCRIDNTLCRFKYAPDNSNLDEIRLHKRTLISNMKMNLDPLEHLEVACTKLSNDSPKDKDIAELKNAIETLIKNNRIMVQSINKMTSKLNTMTNIVKNLINP